MTKRVEDLTEVEIKTTLKLAAEAVEFAFVHAGVEKPLFALVVFNDPKIGQYIGNCNREDIILALRETADRLEAREDVSR